MVQDAFKSHPSRGFMCMSDREETMSQSQNSPKRLYFNSGLRTPWAVLLGKGMSWFPTFKLLLPSEKEGELESCL